MKPEKNNGTPDLFYAELIGAFFHEAKKRGLYSGDDVFAPDLMQAGRNFTNVVLYSEEMRDGSRGDLFAYYYGVAELLLYAGAYHTHFWALGDEPVNTKSFAMRYAHSGCLEAAEPYMPLGKNELRDLCDRLYDIFAERIEPYVQQEDLDAYICSGMNAFFAVSVAITAKHMGLQREPVPDHPLGDALEAAPAPEAAPAAALPRANEAPSPAPADAQDCPEGRPAVRQGAIPDVADASAPQGDTPEWFWLQLMGDFLSAARQKGYADGKESLISALVQPGIDFTYALMSSKPFYDGNKHDMPHYYFKIARYCFYAGAYYAHLWNKQSTDYLAEDFHLKILRAGLPAAADPVMPLTREEVFRHVFDLYLWYTDEVAQYANHPEYPVFVANGMHAFYMSGTMVQLKAMRIP